MPPNKSCLAVFALLLIGLYVNNAFAETPFKDGPLVTRAKALVKAGNRTQAFRMLDAEAKQQGSPEQGNSAYYAGLLILENTNIQERTKLAEKYFRLADRLDHRLSGFMLKQLSNIDKSIADASDVDNKVSDPLSAEYRKAYDAAKRREKEDQAHLQILLFTKNPNDDITLVTSLENRLTEQYPKTVHFNYYLVMSKFDINDPEMSTPPKLQITLPPTGFTPDFEGQYSTKLGITQLPAFVIKTDNFDRVFYSFNDMRMALYRSLNDL